MKATWNVGGGASAYTIRGPLAIIVICVYIAAWLLIATAAVEVAWAVVFGGLLG